MIRIVLACVCVCVSNFVCASECVCGLPICLCVCGHSSELKLIIIGVLSFMAAVRACMRVGVCVRA